MNSNTSTETSAPTPLALQPQPVGGFSLTPRNLDEAFRLADMMASSDLVPKDFRNKPGNVLIAMQWGQEIGLKPLQALQNIAIINGRPCLWGDAVLALVRSSPLCEYVLEEMGTDGVAICRVKRRGEPEQIRTFSDLDAKVAGLSNKDGPWKTAPKRMKQMRARSFALRDVFTDILKGMDIAEVAMDYTELAPGKVAVDTGPVVAAPDDFLLERAEMSASEGVATYAGFWREISRDERQQLASRHAQFKAQAEAADQARTVTDVEEVVS
jgi:hypothetical protein